MNIEQFQFQTLVLSAFDKYDLQIKESLRCLLHTIVFNRALGIVEPQDMDSDIFNLTYVMCKDDEIYHKIEDGIANFLQGFIGKKVDKGKICIAFYVTRSVPTWGIFTKEEKVFWERWVIPISVSRAKDRNSIEQRQHLREQALRESMTFIIQQVNEKKEHIPPVPSNPKGKSLVFSFDISYKLGDGESEAWGFEMIKDILKQGPPQLMKNN